MKRLGRITLAAWMRLTTAVVVWAVVAAGVLATASVATARDNSSAGASPALMLTTPGCSVQTIPAGMNTVQIQATGASGGYGYQSTNPPGRGSTVSGTLSGVSGQLDVCVNVGGGTVNQGNPGGGFYGGNGGGASGVSVGSNFSQPVLIAGGGGGGGGNPPGESQYQSGAGGDAGYPSGVDGVVSFTSSNNNFACGGTGGSQTGPGVCSEFPETTGGATTGGGPGGGGNESGAGAAGGGAGYYGGGAGLSGGGGGGSDLCAQGTGSLTVGALWNCTETTATAGSPPQVSLSFSYSNPNPAVYVAEPASGQVVEQEPDSGPQVSLGSGLNNPQGTAVDTAGNVFIADTYNNRVVEVPVGGGAQTTIDTNVSSPWGVAIDTAGNVFIADAGNGRVVELPVGGGPAVTIADNLGFPEAVAVDPLGDVFIVDSSNHNVIEVPAGSAQPATGAQKVTIASGLNNPAAVAVDTSGDVFIADSGSNFQGNGNVLEVPPGGQPTTIGAFGYATGVALDAAGNLYVSDQSAGVVEVPADGGTQITVINPGNNQAGDAVAAPTPAFTADTPPDRAPQGQAYSYTYTATTPHGEPAPTFAVASGSLPPGLTLDPSTGVLSGAVSATGTWQFVVEARNAVTASMGPVTTITNAVPAVSAVSPDVGPTAGGGTVTITGTGFAQNSYVAFGSTAATSVQVQSPGSLTATVPPGSSTVDVTVATVGGTSPTSSADHYTYDAMPTVTRVSPAGGPTVGGTTVTITGTHFLAGATVDFGSNPATSVSVKSATQLTATAPSAGPGTVDVTVTTPGGTSPTSSADEYGYDRPTVSRVSPAAGPVAGGNTVTITGTNFVSGATVHLGASAATSVTFKSATQLTATVPSASPGTVDVTVTTQGGTSPASSADRYTYDATPTVTGVSPNGGPITGGNTVTITGTNFVSGATVHFGSKAGTSVNVPSSTTLTAVAPTGSDGTVDVTVSTPGGSSATSSADKYAYTPQAGAVFGVDSGSTTGSGQLVQMLPSGAQTTLASGLNDPSGVGVDAAGDVFVVLFNSYVVEYPADGSAQRTLAGNGYPESLAVDPQGDVFVGNGSGVQEYPAGGGQVTLAQNLAYAPGLAVDSRGDVFASEYSGGAVLEVHPNGTQTTVAGGLNSPQGLAVDLKGDVFIAEHGSNHVVKVPAGGGTPTTVGSGVQSPTGVSLDAAGNLFISQGYPANNVIEVPAGGGAQTTLANLTGPTGVAAYAPAPTFTSDTPPNYAPVGQAYSYTYAASTPPGEPNATFALASGKLPPGLTLNATTGVLSGTPTSSGTFTFAVQTQNAVQRSVSPLTGITTLAPTVSRVSPDAGPTSGGGTVTITGTGFVPGARVAFGTGNYAGNVTYKSATSLTATVPPHATAVVDVSVLTGGGTSPTGQADLYAYGTPTVTRVSPNAGSTAGGGTVTITGTGFVPGSVVAFGSVHSSTVTYVSTTRLTAVAPPQTARNVDIRVSTAAGTSPTAPGDTYTYGN
jgi:sugar lactone lactonase YvrE